MTMTRSLARLAALAVVLLVGLGAPGQSAARRGAPAVRVECSSLKDRYQYCRTYTVGRARLERQLSKTRCREHQTWGSDGDGSGIWVRDGCRGVFVVERSPWGGGSRPKPQTITCTSRDYEYNHCDVSTWGRDVWVKRQISRQRCVQGKNWGVDWRGIWVNGGCNAEFAVD